MLSNVDQFSQLEIATSITNSLSILNSPNTLFSVFMAEGVSADKLAPINFFLKVAEYSNPVKYDF